MWGNRARLSLQPNYLSSCSRQRFHSLSLFTKSFFNVTLKDKEKNDIRLFKCLNKTFMGLQLTRFFIIDSSGDCNAVTVFLELK